MSRCVHTNSLVLLAVAISLSGVATHSMAADGGAVAQVEPTRTIQLPLDIQSQQAAVVSGIALDQEGNRLAVAGDDHLVRIFDCQTGDQLHKLAAHADWVRTVAFRSDGRVLATAGDDRRIQFWNVPMSQPDRAPTEQWQTPGHGGSIRRLVFSPDGRLLAAAGFEKQVRVYDGTNGRLLHKFDAPDSDVCALTISPDSCQLAAAGHNGILRIWQLDGNLESRDVKAQGRCIHALAYSPDCSLLASAGKDRAIRLWDTASARQIAVIPQRPGTVSALAFCGLRMLAAGSTDNLIRVWDVHEPTQREPKETSHLVGHTGSITTLVFHAATNTLVSGSFDTTVRFWSLAD